MMTLNSTLFTNHQVDDVDHNYCSLENVVVDKQLIQYMCQYKVQIIKKLGNGAFADVYHASMGDQSIAMKIINKPEKNSSKAIEVSRMICGEVNAFKLKLQHPNIIQIISIFEGEQQFIELMTLCSDPLTDQVTINCFVHPDLLAYAADCYDIVNALAYMHNRGILYRDLKPDNIMRNSDQRLVLIDLGTCAKYVKGQMDQQVGTDRYMSVEQMDSEDYDFSTDIFAAGIIFRELFDGVFPFVETDDHYFKMSKVSQQIKPPPTEWPAEFSSLVFSMLEKDSTKRPTAVQLKRDLTLIFGCEIVYDNGDTH